MSFAFPAFLWALSALAIPILIHLFNFRRTKRVLFSTNRFLREVQQAHRAQRKLRQYLILASRLLFLFFLVVAFAQPFIPASQTLDPSAAVTVYLDNSQSMSSQEDGARHFETGVEFIRELVQTLPRDTRYRLLTNDFSPFSQNLKAAPEVLDHLTELKLSGVSRSFDEVHARLKQLCGSADCGQLFWLSDFQRSTLGTAALLPDSSFQWHVVPFPLARATNIYIDSAYLENPLSSAGERNSVRIDVRNHGPRPVDNLVIRLSLNGVQAATASAALPADSKSSVSFDLSPGLTGLNEARVSFEDFPVSFDNEFFMALNFSGKIRVVELLGGGPSLARVYGNAQVFSFKSFASTNVDYSQLPLADLLILNSVPRFDPGVLSAVQSYLFGGGQVAVIPAPDADVLSYSALLALPGLSKSAESTLTPLDRPDVRNPFYEKVFESSDAPIRMPSARTVLEWGNDRSALLSLSSGKPFLSQFDRAGRIYLFASPLDVAYTDFINHAIVVPVMYRMAAWGRNTGERIYHSLNESLIAIPSDSLAGEEPVRLAGHPDVVPSQRRAAGQVFIEMPRMSMWPGFYRVMHNQDTLALLALNLDKKESVLESLTDQELRSLFARVPSADFFDAASAATFSIAIKERYLGRPLWKYAILLALLFLLAEVLLIRFVKA
jgi:hypothetical protein